MYISIMSISHSVRETRIQGMPHRRSYSIERDFSMKWCVSINFKDSKDAESVEEKCRGMGRGTERFFM